MSWAGPGIPSRQRQRGCGSEPWNRSPTPRTRRCGMATGGPQFGCAGYHEEATVGCEDQLRVVTLCVAGRDHVHWRAPCAPCGHAVGNHDPAPAPDTGLQRPQCDQGVFRPPPSSPRPRPAAEKPRPGLIPRMSVPLAEPQRKPKAVPARNTTASRHRSRCAGRRRVRPDHRCQRRDDSGAAATPRCRLRHLTRGSSFLSADARRNTPTSICSLA